MAIGKPETSFVIPLALLSAAMAGAVPATLLVRNGPASNRIDVVYIAEGYTASELGSFASTVDAAIQYKDTATLAQPYKRYRKFFNYYRVDLPSPQSGIDESDKGILRNTALDGDGRGNRGFVNLAKANAAVAEAMQGFSTKSDWTFAVFNTPGYYNSGGPVCVFSYPNYGEIALHEAGHSFHGLADEYGGPGTYSGVEVKEINVSKDPAAPKWAHWKGYQQPTVGAIGSFQGARYFDQGIYRPSFNSKMRLTSHSRPQSHNMPSIEKIIQDLYVLVRPLDSWMDNLAPVTDPDSLWVKTVDPAVFLVDWYIDGQLVRSNGGETFRSFQHPMAVGIHKVKARVYDEAVVRAFSDNARPHPLDLIRKGLDRLQQDVEWTVEVRRIHTGTRIGLGSPRPSEASPRSRPDRDGNLVFDLPRDGAYRLRILTAAGKEIEVLNGTGRKGTTVHARPTNRVLPAGPIFLRVESGLREW